MNRYSVPLLLVAVLLFAGCALPVGGAAESGQGNSSKGETLPALPSDQPGLAPTGQPSGPQETAAPDAPSEPPSAAGQPSGACTVEFMKDDVSNLFYVMVKTNSAAEASVTCPNGDAGKRQNGLFFCGQLDYPAPAIAYLGGVECGRAHFLDANTNKPVAGKSSCRITASPSRITVGGTSVITVKVYTPESKAAIAYQCGDTEQNSSASGMTEIGKICRFNTAGAYDVYVKLNGEICATAPLTVFEDSKGCSVSGSNFTIRQGELVYSARVAARGYSGTDSIWYKCNGDWRQVLLSTIPSPADFTTTIECTSKSVLQSGIPVKVGNDSCGEIKVPA